MSANVVHASKNARLALRRLHDLLAPAGLLILIESTTHFIWFDMTTGLIEGWQHFDDDLRSDNPLLAADKWVEVLLDAGFEEANSWPGCDSCARHLGQHVLVARVAGEPAPETGTGNYQDNGAQAVIPEPVEQVRTFQQQLIDTLPADRLELMRSFVRDRVVQVLRLDAAEPPERNERLMDLGLDSLMAVKLRNLLGKGLGIERPLSASLMFDCPTIETLAAYLLDRFGPPTQDGDPATHQPSPYKPEALGIAAVAAMSDAEIEAQLLKRLGSNEQPHG